MWIISRLNDFIWGIPLTCILLLLHIYMTYKTNFIQKKLFSGIRLSLRGNSFKTLATTLAATLGTGNIIGMSGAIYLGGPGAVFWCWITGILGMATCYGECCLGVLYRDKSKHLGGPMYVLKNGLHMPKLAICFCVFTIMACFGVGCTTQANALAVSLKSSFNLPVMISGFIFAILCGFIINGGLEGISKLCTYLVPFMTLIFIIMCIILLVLCRSTLPEALTLIISDAFTGKSVLYGTSCGIIGIISRARYGISRGLFTNEAGLGSTSIAAGSDRSLDADGDARLTAHRQGLISMTSVFWDTVVMCFITGLVIVACTLKNPPAFSNMSEGNLMDCSFSLLGNAGGYLLTFCVVLFAFATLNGWCYFGECALIYLVNEMSSLIKHRQRPVNDSPAHCQFYIKIFHVAYIVMIFAGAAMDLSLVWELCDLFNAFMLIPNLICLIRLRSDYPAITISQEPDES